MNLDTLIVAVYLLILGLLYVIAGQIHQEIRRTQKKTDKLKEQK